MAEKNAKVFGERLRASLINRMTDKIMRGADPNSLDGIVGKVMEDISAGPVAEIPIEVLHPHIDADLKEAIVFFVKTVVGYMAPVVERVYEGSLDAEGQEFRAAMDEAEKKVMDEMEGLP